MAFSKCLHVVSIGALVVILSAILQTVCVLTIDSPAASNMQSSASSSTSVVQKLIKQDSNVPMSHPSSRSMGDIASLDEWIVSNSNKQRRVDSFGDDADLVPAAGHSKKYILVKKKPKHKKIKMEVFEPKMKYKKIKMKIPVMKKKKKKVKGYLVKKEHYHH